MNSELISSYDVSSIRVASQRPQKGRSSDLLLSKNFWTRFW